MDRAPQRTHGPAEVHSRAQGVACPPRSRLSFGRLHGKGNCQTERTAHLRWTPRSPYPTVHPTSTIQVDGEAREVGEDPWREGTHPGQTACHAGLLPGILTIGDISTTHNETKVLVRTAQILPNRGNQSVFILSKCSSRVAYFIVFNIFNVVTQHRPYGSLKKLCTYIISPPTEVQLEPCFIK